MCIDHRIIDANLADVRSRIENALARAGRAPHSVTLIAVTKSVGVDEVCALAERGVTHFGENRLAGILAKRGHAPGSLCWHMIGAVQRRKAKDIVGLFDTVDSVDRLELAEELDKRSQGMPRPLPVLVEVNVSGEASKHGFAPGQLEEALPRMRLLKHIEVQGLMTMAPYEDEVERVRPVFGRLAMLARQAGLPRVSMGMTNDFEIAVEEGATEVRIGSALFERREE